MQDIYHPSNPVKSSIPWSPQMVSALDRLLAQTTNPTLERIYIYDLVAQNTLCANCTMVSMLGYPTEPLYEMSETMLAALIHPDDLNSVGEHYQRFATLEAGEVLIINYRMKQADGNWSWLRSQETPLVMASDGFPLLILGFVQITDDFSTRTLEKCCE